MGDLREGGGGEAGDLSTPKRGGGGGERDLKCFQNAEVRT